MAENPDSKTPTPKKDDGQKKPGYRGLLVIIVLILLAIIGGIWFFGGRGAAEDAQPVDGAGMATITVTQKVGDASKEVQVPEGATVYEVLTNSGVPYESAEGSYGPYVTSIDGKASEGDGGWRYSVNGEEPTVGCDATSVAAGDTIQWTYVDNQ